MPDFYTMASDRCLDLGHDSEMNPCPECVNWVYGTARATIAAQAERIEVLEAALRPLARFGECFDAVDYDFTLARQSDQRLYVGLLHEAAAALAPEPDDGEEESDAD